MATFRDSANRSRSQRDQPRRITGGVKTMRIEADRHHWAALRWLRLLDKGVDGQTLRTGLEYVALGQTRSVEIAPGAVVASVQGIRRTPHEVRLGLETIPPAAWDSIADAIIADASLAAPILAGDLPQRIEDAFSSAGTTFLPRSFDEFHLSCTCSEKAGGRRPEGGGGGPGATGLWCWHMVCAAQLAADVIQRDPMRLFRLRGLDRRDLVDRIKRRRAARGSIAGASLAYSQTLNRPDAQESAPIELCLERFWDGEPSVFEQIDTTPTPAEPTHALLRRLGPSVYKDARFPLVGLLATCYDEIARYASESLADQGSQDSTDGVSALDRPD